MKIDLQKIAKYICSIAALAFSLSAGAQEFKRDIELNTFVPKGQWIVNSFISYSEHTEKNYQFVVIDGINSDGYTFKVSPGVLYAFRDNMAIGGGVNYKRSLMKLSGVTLNLDEDNQFDIDDIYQLTHSYSATATLRNYISLGNSKRFGLFCDLQLEAGGGQGKIITGTGTDLTGTFTKTTEFGIGAAPGMVAFINNYTAVEISVGVLGFDFTKTRQVTDQVYLGDRSLNSASCKINLLSIGLGISFYL
jgi:hypothetical protein